MRHLWRTFCILLLMGAVAARAGTIVVFAAASLSDALTEIGRDYEKTSGADKVVFNFAASSLLARQIEEGAPADIFFSADDAKMDALQSKGLIATETRTNRLSNWLAVIVPLDSTLPLVELEDLKRPELRRLALADPQAVPVGVYAKQWLTMVGLWTNVAPKVVPCANVRAALAAVESGNAEAGIVFQTDAAISKKVKVAFAPHRGAGPDILYPMAMVKETHDAAAAQKFLAYLNSTSAGRVFDKFGFVVLPRPL